LPIPDNFGRAAFGRLFLFERGNAEVGTTFDARAVPELTRSVGINLNERV
jgi:hypothetical protein